MSATVPAVLIPARTGQANGGCCFDAQGVPREAYLLRQLVDVMEAGNCSRETALLMIRCEHELSDARG